MRGIPDYEMKSFKLEDVFGKNVKGWIKDPQGNNAGGWGIKLTLRDMARFGFLYLNGGFWDGEQVISKTWVEESTAPNPNDYGYLWWLRKEDGIFSYSAMGAGGNIFINLRGREPAGTVEPGVEYEQLCNQISAALMDLRDPENGSRITKRVYRREELYHGPFLDKAPDLLVEWADYTFWGRGRYDSRAPIFETQKTIDLTDIPLTGTHRPEGILIANGKGIRAGAVIDESRILDMAPTIMSLLSIAPPKEMDGKILNELLTPEELQRIAERVPEQDIETLATEFQYTAEEEEIITDHLKALGYL